MRLHELRLRIGADLVEPWLDRYPHAESICARARCQRVLTPLSGSARRAPCTSSIARQIAAKANADASPVLGATGAARVLNLSARGDLIEAAANLFPHLRALD